MCLTLTGTEIKEDKSHVSAARATTEKWVIYMPTEQLGSNLHASCSVFQSQQQMKSKRKEEGKAGERNGGVEGGKVCRLRLEMTEDAGETRFD